MQGNARSDSSEAVHLSRISEFVPQCSGRSWLGEYRINPNWRNPMTGSRDVLGAEATEYLRAIHTHTLPMHDYLRETMIQSDTSMILISTVPSLS